MADFWIGCGIDFGYWRRRRECRLGTMAGTTIEPATAHDADFEERRKRRLSMIDEKKRRKSTFYGGPGVAPGCVPCACSGAS